MNDQTGSKRVLCDKLVPRDKPSFVRNLRCRAVKLLLVVLEPFLPAVIEGQTKSCATSEYVKFVPFNVKTYASNLMKCSICDNASNLIIYGESNYGTVSKQHSEIRKQLAFPMRMIFCEFFSTTTSTCMKSFAFGLAL